MQEIFYALKMRICIIKNVILFIINLSLDNNIYRMILKYLMKRKRQIRRKEAKDTRMGT